MLHARKFITHTVAIVLTIAVWQALLAKVVRAEDADSQCQAPGLAVLASPLTPWQGAPLRVVITSDNAEEGELSLISPDGNVAVRSDHRFDGPPYFWFAEIESPAAGTWQAKLARSGATGPCATITKTIVVRKSKGAPPNATDRSVWPVRNQWNRENENLYSAWIAKLFDAPIEESLSWKALHIGLLDPKRNFLFDHLSANEDNKLRIVRPDCADLPYFLRAYFSFKMGLPFGYAKCSRGGGGRPPRCPRWYNIEQQEAPPEPEEKKQTASNSLFGIFDAQSKKSASKRAETPRGLVPAFAYFLRSTLANGVHSGSGRTAAADNNTDYYPVSLKEETLRPGTIYADPYGHILVLVRRVPQTTGDAGIFLAVDGQPDGTVARKRFWRGNFLFSDDQSLGSAGFKRFRPIIDTKRGMRRLTNEEIANNPDYADVSLEQAKISTEGFYDRMDDVMSPNPLDPMRAMKDLITSLEEQVVTRVTSVENGRKYLAGGKTASMPDGFRIFETTGAWEDFATPSRDLRLLIAIDVVRNFPERVARRPERYAMPEGKSVADVKAELDRVLASELQSRKFKYTRTDGSPWELSLQDILDRMTKLEMAYNVNDCVELRWGATPKSPEADTCKARAPSEQRAKMAKYRDWFRDRRRPPRG